MDASAPPTRVTPKPTHDLIVRDLGYLDYRTAWEIQLETHAAVAEGRQPPTLLLVEHPPVITFGKKGGRGNLIADPAWLEAQGFSLHDIERGGDVTYHGPGQLVGYPILPVGRAVRSYLRNLEAVMVRVLAEYGVSGVGSPGYAGVWVGDEKVVAIGVAIKRNVSFHGFAMNIQTNLQHFSYIVPCGISDRGVTSLSKLVSYPVTLNEVKPKLVRAFTNVFKVSVRTAEDAEAERVESEVGA
jgi:lipoyl(octanoyl) transferase